MTECMSCGVDGELCLIRVGYGIFDNWVVCGSCRVLIDRVLWRL